MSTQAKRIRLTAAEIEAILSIAGDADAGASVESYPEDEQQRVLDAFEAGMDKLRSMLASRARSLLQAKES